MWLPANAKLAIVYSMDGKENRARPPRPNEVILDLMHNHLRVTQTKLAEAMGVSRPRMNMLIKGRLQISPNTALRLERVSGIRAEYWTALQAAYDLFEEESAHRQEFDQLQRLNVYIPVSNVPQLEQIHSEIASRLRTPSPPR